MYVILLLAPVLLCGGANIPPPLIESVFGVPGNIASTVDKTALSSNYPNVTPITAPATPIYPINENRYNQSINNVDYVDTVDEYRPTDADYDNFDLDLTKRIASRSSDNFLLSPLGLKLPLAILTEAASGPTQMELDSVLSFDKDKTQLRKKFSRILDSLQTKSPRNILNLASRIYVDNHNEISHQYASIAYEFYGTEVFNLDFSQPKLAANTINEWVGNSTKGRITDLVTEDDVTLAVLMVIDTLFFKGTWRNQFPPSATKNDIFYVSPIVVKNTPFMTVTEKFYYAKSTKLNAKILRMPYLGSKFAWYIVLPDTLTGLDQIINNMTVLRTEMLNLRQTMVTVTVPKFKFEYTAPLVDTLKEMGIKQAFDGSAPFPGIFNRKDLHQSAKISKVLQRCGIEINEEGSVAYAATEILLSNKFGDPVEYEEVTANRPFLFFIQDEVTKQLLFAGRLSDPTSSSGDIKTT